MNSFVFVDTCIIIDFVNGKLKLDDNAIQNYCFNTIVDMEVLVGVENSIKKIR